VGGPCANRQRVGSDVNTDCGDNDDPTEHQIAKGGGGRFTSINVPAMKSHILGSALSKATADWGSASREERIIAHFFLFSFFKLLENAWYQRRAGILDQAQWVGWETVLRKYYHADGVRRVWWPGRKDAYSPEFQTFLSGTKPADELGSLNELFDYVERNG
jgi:hypothetical protein